MRIAAALTWEYWRHSGALILLTGFGAAALPVFIYGAFDLSTSSKYSKEILSVSTEEGRAMHQAFLVSACLLIVVVACRANGLLRRYLTMPVGVLHLVGVKMLQSFVASGLMYVIMATTLNGLFYLDWPIVGPALFMGTASVLMLGATWTWDGRRYLQVTTAVVIGASLMVWLGSHYELQSLARISTERVWSTVGLSDAAIVSLAALTSWLVTSWVVSSRRGETKVDSKPSAGDRNLSSQAATEFKGPKAALSWLESTQRGRPALIAVSICCGVLLFVALLPHVTSYYMSQLVEASLAFLFLLSGLIGFFLGQRSTQQVFDSYTATLPVSDASLAEAILKNVLKCAFAVWFLWLGTLGTITLGFMYFEEADASSVMRFVSPSLVGCLAVLAFSWCLMANGALLGLSRRRVAAVSFLTMVAGFFFVVAGDLLSHWLGETRTRSAQLALLNTIAALPYALLILFAAVGWRLRLVTRFPLSLAVVLMLVFSTTIVSERDLHRYSAMDYYGLGACCGALVVPILGIPVATWWSRHR